MTRTVPLTWSSRSVIPQRTPQSTARLYQRCLHHSPTTFATPLPVTQPGPPPSAPRPAASQYGEQIDRRRRQAELFKRGQEMRSTQAKPGNAMKKRFWKDVSVTTADGKPSSPWPLDLFRQIYSNRYTDGAHVIYLDTRPVRNPQSKLPLAIPPSKAHLATAIALEWDLLVSAQQALRSHLIPLTSMASRAHDLSLQDSAASSSSKPSPESSTTPQSSPTIRNDIINTVLRYLDTDTLLCWSPPPSSSSKDTDTSSQLITPSLRDLQIQTAQPIISHLTTNIWPGIELRPGLESGSILPTPQLAASRDVIRGWVAGLNAWELVGLERAVLAGKSLCVGARLITEWGESFADLRERREGESEEEGGRRKRRFGIEEAAEACSLEVRWQTGRWGEVEDTHDVEKEDLRRQFGSAILVAAGE
ncbi:MAG: hypothetical protein Q9190_005861 [Brigantiaea leucoxantha]